MSKLDQLNKILEEQKPAPIICEATQEDNAGPVYDPVVDTTAKRTEEKTEKKDVTPALIPVSDDGRLQFQNHQQISNYCSYMIKSGMVPDRFDTAPKLFGALMYVRDLGLPDTAIRQVANIKGTPSVYGDLPLAIAWRSGKLESIHEYWFDKDYNRICFENKNLNAEVYGSVSFIKRKGYEQHSYSYTLDDARTAGVWPPKQSSAWERHPKLMLRYKSRAIGLKAEIPDALNGISIAEYDHDEIPEKDVTPIEVKESFQDRLEKLKSGKSN